MGNIAILIAAAAIVITACASADATDTEDAADIGEGTEVAGTGTHYFTTAIIHSQEPSAEQWTTQRSTDIVELRGDLEGYVLYHVTSQIADGKMVNTGKQAFSGTIRGSEPVFLFDDEFRFEVDLASGATVGTIRLRESADAQEGAFRCNLEAAGTGLTEDGNATIGWTGTCEAIDG